MGLKGGILLFVLFLAVAPGCRKKPEYQSPTASGDYLRLEGKIEGNAYLIRKDKVIEGERYF